MQRRRVHPGILLCLRRSSGRSREVRPIRYSWRRDQRGDTTTRDEPWHGLASGGLQRRGVDHRLGATRLRRRRRIDRDVLRHQPTNSRITYYFRRSFTVANPGGFTALTVRYVRDDGA